MLEQLNKLLEANVIRPSQAAEYSQVLLVPKPGENKWRLCVDYRALNDAMLPMGWPIPNIRRIFQRLGSKKATLFGVLDLIAGFHQVLMSEILIQISCRSLIWLDPYDL